MYMSKGFSLLSSRVIILRYYLYYGTQFSFFRMPFVQGVYRMWLQIILTIYDILLYVLHKGVLHEFFFSVDFFFISDNKVFPFKQEINCTHTHTHTSRTHCLCIDSKKIKKSFYAYREIGDRISYPIHFCTY